METDTKNSVVHKMWEEYNRGQRRHWPPSEKEIATEVEKEEDSKGWDDRAPGS